MNGIIVLAVYAAVMMITTVLFTKKTVSGDNFHVADRNMGTITSAMSIAATWIWAPALFTSAEKAYMNGITGLIWFLMPNILCLLLFIPFAKKIRRRMPNGITLSGFMGTECKSMAVKGVYGFQLTALAVLSTAVQLLAGGTILSSITGMDFMTVTIILALIAFAYSQFSGIRASVVTDTVQMIFMLAACMVFVPMALSSGDGVQNMISGMAGVSGKYGSFIDQSGIEVMISYGLPTAIGLISGPFGDQCFWQRAFSISEKKIGRAFFIGTLLFAVVPASMGILGFIAAGSGYKAVNSGIVNFELITHLFPVWAVLPFLFMLISGLLSTVDSNLCAVASLTTDMEKEHPKLAMVLLLMAGIVVANIPGLTVTKLFLIYGTLRATTLLPTVFTLCRVKLPGMGIVAGVSIALGTGLPVFTYATLNNLALLKTVASIYTVLISGVVALAAAAVVAIRKRGYLDD